MHSNNRDLEHEIEESRDESYIVPLEDRISNKQTLKFMKKHFRKNEKTIYIDEFVEILYQEFKNLFQGLKYTDVDYVKQEIS
jgi:hypothetical protein